MELRDNLQENATGRANDGCAPRSVPVFLSKYDSIEKGMEIDGIVKNITDFGAFVDLLMPFADEILTAGNPLQPRYPSPDQRYDFL